MANPSDLTRLVPGFDFLQNLIKGAGAGIPGMNQWIAPTINPEELDKRISELKTVQFWLENNARLLATTIQALEVQRMTLNTLQSMNLPLADLRDALRIDLPKSAPAAPAAEPPPAAKAPAPAKKAAPRKTAAAGPAAPPAVDPMQWWGALTQQFTELATKALKDGAAETARTLAGAAVKQAAAGAGDTLMKAASMPAQAASAALRRGSRAAAKKRAG